MPEQTPQEYLMTAVETLTGTVRTLSERVKKLEEPDPRATPDDYLREQFKNTIGALNGRLTSLEEFFKEVMEDNLIQYHGDRIRAIEYAMEDRGTADSDVNPLVSPMEQLRRVVTAMHEMQDAIRLRMSADDVLDLADRLEARAEEYRKPYVGKSGQDFWTTPSSGTWTALKDVARALRESLEPEEEEVEDEVLRWEDLEIVTKQNLEAGGVDVSVSGPEGGIVKAVVPHGMWEGIVELIARKDADELVERLAAMIDNN